jgi:hypothetical protein
MLLRWAPNHHPHIVFLHSGANSMSYKIYPFVAGGFLSLGGAALAEDAPSARPGKTPKHDTLRAFQSE